jgi:hypothetical protein
LGPNLLSHKAVQSCFLLLLLACREIHLGNHYRNELDAFEKEQREAKPILRWEVGIILPIIFMYVSAWGYMIVDVFVGLRRLPIGAFTTFEVTDMLPHW